MHLAHPIDAMSVATLPENVTYSISQTGNGWLLVIETETTGFSERPTVSMRLPLISIDTILWSAGQMHVLEV